MTGVRIRGNEPGADTASVFLDGVPLVECCLEADDVEGWVDVLTRDAAGRLVLEYNGRVAVRRLFGRVEITRPAPPD